MPKDRSANRQSRREGRQRNDRALLTQVERETRAPRRRRVEVRPLNAAQARYDAAIASSSIVFGIGPAGTGKTWLAAARAAEAFNANEVERIVIVRPIMEAEEENLGFLPGTADEKTTPYQRPVLDCLADVMSPGQIEYGMKAKRIEFLPMAYMRGKTLKDCWVLADEMQNATEGQFKLLLSRIGENAKFIINGDPRQTDPAVAGRSGLEDAIRRLGHLPQVAVCRFDRTDIVRSGLCRAVVEAYETGPGSRPSPERYDDTRDEHGLVRRAAWISATTTFEGSTPIP